MKNFKLKDQLLYKSCTKSGTSFFEYILNKPYIYILSYFLNGLKFRVRNYTNNY